MFDFLNPSVKYALIVIIICAIAICSCVIIERIIKHFFPISDEELQRIMAENRRRLLPAALAALASPAAPATPAPTARQAPIVPQVIITIHPAESDDEISLQETPILRSNYYVEQVTSL
ncbi:hypothetical protein GCK72_024250 [Caenorhabditis remanei]|uniref:Uncharacterized protein n=1 Tax=Caenorhabditis remanei TaxID=31234 RepID=A0A6A5FZC1_CAERE|nr:hypothetical protein GCK72_024250 [Caenorhabditis remanei]KAF1747784.1 hypothetical protein GCK72_024250 [Caenorhabditis remanei]